MKQTNKPVRTPVMGKSASFWLVAITGRVIRTSLLRILPMLLILCLSSLLNVLNLGCPSPTMTDMHKKKKQAWCAFFSQVFRYGHIKKWRHTKFIQNWTPSLCHAKIGVSISKFLHRGRVAAWPKIKLWSTSPCGSMATNTFLQKLFWIREYLNKFKYRGQ